MTFSILRHLRDQFKVNVLAPEYPGYGLLSHREPSEQALNEVALTVLRYLVDEVGVRYSQIVLFGRSLGSGPAVYLAAQYPVGGLILVSAFASIKAAVQSIVGRVAAWTFAERFPNSRIISNVSCSTLFIHGEADSLIPADHSLRLFKRCRARKLLVTPKKMEHNSNLFGDASFLAVPAIHFFGFPGYYTVSPPRLPAHLFEDPTKKKDSLSDAAKGPFTCLKKPLFCDCFAKHEAQNNMADGTPCKPEGTIENISIGFPEMAMEDPSILQMDPKSYKGPSSPQQPHSPSAASIGEEDAPSMGGGLSEMKRIDVDKEEDEEDEWQEQRGSIMLETAVIWVQAISMLGKQRERLRLTKQQQVLLPAREEPELGARALLDWDRGTPWMFPTRSLDLTLAQFVTPVRESDMVPEGCVAEAYHHGRKAFPGTDFQGLRRTVQSLVHADVVVCVVRVLKAQRDLGSGSLAEEGSHRGRPPLAPGVAAPKARATAGMDKAVSSTSSSKPHVARTRASAQPAKERPAGKQPGKLVVEPTEAAQPARNHEKEGHVLRDYVSDDLRKVLDEEEVTYSWRRRPKEEQKAEKVATVAKPKAPEPVSKPLPEPLPGPSQVREVGEGSGNVGLRGGTNSDPRSSGYGRSSLLPLAKLERPSKAAAPGPAKPPGKIDLEAAKARLPEALRWELVQPQVQLVTYDGSAPSLRPGPLCCGAGDQVPAVPIWLARWLQGKCSSAVASLSAESWLQSEQKWEKEATKETAPSALATIAGLHGDPSVASAALRRPPNETAAQAIIAVLRESGKEAGELLVSEVEVALTKLETESMGDPQAYLSSALHREVWRYACCQLPEHAPTGLLLGDAWLRSQLQQTAQEIVQSCKASSEEVLRMENRFLDRYLVQLLGVKRRLSALLDEWEKIDHYAILGVPRTVSDKELRNAYRKACLRLHPDKGGDKQQFQQLQDSYARILEEREKEKSAVPTLDGGKWQRPAPAEASSGEGPLALEAPEAPEAPAAAEAMHPAAAEVVSSVSNLQHLAGQLQKLVAEAEHVDRLVRSLRKTPPKDGVEALANAQQAGETLLSVSQKMSEAAPLLSEAAMEVAECSLSVAARYAAVPCALLLTDVALSCTLEASRLKHTGQLLHEVRRDTIGTLQTLQANLSMAKIVGTIDAETLKLSLGLVGKATSRIMAAVRQVGAASVDAVSRGGHCAAHSRAVCRFAEGRSAAEAEASEEVLEALPAPEEASHPSSPEPDAPPPRAPAAPAPSAAEKPQARPESPASRARQLELQARLQNDRLLRQLNADLQELRRRAVAGLVQRSPSCSPEAYDMVAELLLSATESVVEAFVPEPESFRALLLEHFDFVLACGCEVQAIPFDLRAQLLQYLLIVDSQAVLTAMEHQVKPRLLRCCQASAKEDLLVPVLQQHFEQLATAVVSARLR
ncbi:abhd13 [Symbiodinium natans]|uniref:Abhd13 protein n=1 Tax=Symbiodinium natans TaxID=878477 RepID=A0A812NB14_9DINO|nr:abhd13 [Symbiodinium natans]